MLGYDFRSKKFFIEWVFDCPKSSWKQTKRMMSLPDLANSHLYQSLLNVPSTISASLHPANGEVVIDLTAIQIDDFLKVNRPLAPPSGLNLSVSGKDAETTFPKDNPMGLSENGDYQISWANLYSTQFPDEEQILNSQ
jgi:hypothetical protein